MKKLFSVSKEQVRLLIIVLIFSAIIAFQYMDQSNLKQSNENLQESNQELRDSKRELQARLAKEVEVNFKAQQVIEELLKELQSNEK